MTPISVKEIARLFKGKIVGDDSREFTSVSKIDQAIPGSLSFLSNVKYEDHIYKTEAGIVLVNHSLELKHKVRATLVKVDDPYSVFCEVLNKFFNNYSSKDGIETNARVHESVN